MEAGQVEGCGERGEGGGGSSLDLTLTCSSSQPSPQIPSSKQLVPQNGKSPQSAKAAARHDVAATTRSPGRGEDLSGKANVGQGVAGGVWRQGGKRARGQIGLGIDRHTPTVGPAHLAPVAQRPASPDPPMQSWLPLRRNLPSPPFPSVPFPSLPFPLWLFFLFFFSFFLAISK